METSIDLPTTCTEQDVLPESLWEIVERLTAENIVERGEIKKVIGESLIDETIDLHVELQSLNEIWADDFNDGQSDEPHRLPDPPFLRENLEKQITMLVDLLQKKLTVRDGRQEGFTAFLSNEERDIIKSISRESSADSSRKMSASNRQSPSQFVAVTATTIPSPRTLLAKSTILEDGMNIFEIDKLSDTLRLEFENERKELMSGIEKIQTALICGSEERDAKSRRQSSATIKELQHLSNKLEKTVLTPHRPAKNPPTASHNSRQSKWSNNFQKPVKLSPSPPSTANTSTYKHPNLLTGAHSARKLVDVSTVSF